MNNRYLVADSSSGVEPRAISRQLEEYFDGYRGVKNILLIPPDASRSLSYAGEMVSMLCEAFVGSEIDILPALGTHAPMSEEAIDKMYGASLRHRFIVHDWRNDTVKVGRVPAALVKEISEGHMDVAIDVDVNRRLLDPKYDLIVSIGQVVPHEVAGFANYTKNVLVGCGGRSMINHSHYLGALYGMERIMGRPLNPVRRLYNYAAEQFLDDRPIRYILTVTTAAQAGVKVEAVSIGRGDELFFETAKISQGKNLNLVERPLEKVVAYLDADKFRTTWVGNKAIYRSRMAIADGGELVVIAPGLRGCGEDLENDRLIKKYGYRSRDEVVAAVSLSEDLRHNLSVAAHLIHGSSEGRFSITYAPGKMGRELILSLGYEYMDLREAWRRYDVSALKDGPNRVNGEDIFFISNPALGLWTTTDRFRGPE